MANNALLLSENESQTIFNSIHSNSWTQKTNYSVPKFFAAIKNANLRTKVRLLRKGLVIIFLVGWGDGLNAYILFCLKLFRIFTVVTWLLNGICHINNNRLAKAKALAPPARGPHFKIFVLIHSKQAQLKLKTYNLLFNHFGVGFECRISKEMEDFFFKNVLGNDLLISNSNNYPGGVSKAGIKYGAIKTLKST